MSYSGQTFRIPCNRGGFTHNPNIDNIDPTMMVEPSRNINLHNNVRESRGGTSKVNTGYGGQRIMRAYDFIQVNGSQFYVVMTSDGKIWKNTTDTIKTGLASSRFPSFVIWNDKLYIANGADRPQVWDGVAASTSDLTDVPTDWSSNTTWPSQLIIHGRGNSERMWALGVPEFPFTLYGSDDNDGISDADFSDANVLLFRAQTQQGNGLVAGVTFGDRLLVASNKKFYRLDDEDLSPDNWGLSEAQWEGGVAHPRLLVKTPNDLQAMDESGNIYSILTSEKFGDYEQASLTRPAFIDRWIREFVDLTDMNEFHVIYDPNRRAVLWFVTKIGQSQNSLALVYLIDRGPIEGWTPPHENIDNDSGYDASSSTLIKVGTGDFKVYTNDYSGNAWEIETANINDDSNAYFHGFRTPDIPDENPRITKKYRRIWLVTQPEGNFEVQVETWIDSKTIGINTVSLAGTGAILGSFVLGTDVLGGDEIIDTASDTGDVGKRIRFEIFNTNVNEDFKITEILYDRKMMGARPQ